MSVRILQKNVKLTINEYIQPYIFKKLKISFVIQTSNITFAYH